MRKSAAAFVGICVLSVSSLAVSPAFAQTITTQSPDIAQAPALSQVFKSAARDFRNLPSGPSIAWLTVGAAASMLGRAGDSNVSRRLGRPHLEETFESGKTIGDLPFQLGGAFATYAIGRMTKSPRTAVIGAELIRAQIVSQSITHAMKYSFRRTRPDGTRFSFPSGHTSITFASATVLQRNLGWKAGVPAFAVASYVAASRIQAKRHYLSDVAFGAAIGIMTGRTVSVGRGKARFSAVPIATPGGGGVSFTLQSR